VEGVLRVARRRQRPVAYKRAAALVLLTLVAAVSPFAASPTHALGNIILVTTTADAEFPADGMCSLRAAILASNVGGFAGYCSPGSSGQDSIRFSLGSGVPVINISLNLPDITQPVTLRGDTGGATRVKVNGPGAAGGGGTGLKFGSAADGSVLRRFVISGFSTGIEADADMTIAGNVISSNTNGIDVYGNVTIGGSNTGSPDPCSDDCNLISGNGVGVAAQAVVTIKGNFIGTNAAGTDANPNDRGVSAGEATGIVIGGTTPAERNIISGNTTSGVNLVYCVACVIQGNYIGTDVTGELPVSNGNGIEVKYAYATIGGTAVGSGNLISGNGDDGIYFPAADSNERTLVYGNRIGVSATGDPLANGGAGIRVDDVNVSIGSVDSPAASNTIAYNYGPGVSYGDDTFIRRNSIHDNGGVGIDDRLDNVDPPQITALGPLAGTACHGCPVDIYSDNGSEGRAYEGTVTADQNGAWSYPGAVSGPFVTATATDSKATSAFSTPVSVVPFKPDGRIRKGSGSLVGNNIYNTTGVNQTKSGSAARGKTITFWISIQNDRNGSDKFKIRATGSTVTGYTVRYFRGTTEITSAVVAGTYQTTSLAKGGVFEIKATVKIGTTATVGSSVSRLVTVTSVGDGTKSDAVKLIGKRS